jgi:hypothetical protein
MYLLNLAPAVRVAQEVREERVVVVAGKAAVAAVISILRPDGNSNCRIIKRLWA